ncbi:helix-turn-helix domain-containing protein [Pelagicoccus sp. SDUM812003]|uniref:helix-turn-helix domain-containing protein n=1 Tax=Pelagicoccus sp. SDUM812003 TaxID=3041267 RepID=UPI0028100DD7|nr:helix-turn-helix domain-containing protein [Pelagicoccus sp. SDUM812003]MDQ8203348.1 helix-turn-helix domain-containing protein [Pelagicoccus sp. SDUM812003]
MTDETDKPRLIELRDGVLPVNVVFTLEEVAEILRVTPETVRRLINDKKLRKLPIRHIRISAVELNRFLALS